MDGVIILTSEEVAVAWDYNYIFTWVGVAIGVILSILLFWIDGLDFGNVILSFLMILMTGLFGFLLTGLFSKPIEFENHYQVTISEEVSMKEFCEKYEILEQEENLFTVREK